MIMLIFASQFENAPRIYLVPDEIAAPLKSSLETANKFFLNSEEADEEELALTHSEYEAKIQAWYDISVATMPDDEISKKRLANMGDDYCEAALPHAHKFARFLVEPGAIPTVSVSAVYMTGEHM